MQSCFSNKAASLQNSRVKTLLIVGPKPPPIGGSPLTVQAMLDELSCYPSVRINFINTSPARDVRRRMTGFNFEKVWRMAGILPRYLLGIRNCDATLVFANDLFATTLVPVLLLAACLFHKPFYLKPVGGSLDLYLQAQNPWLRAFLLHVLRAADAIFAQTQNLESALVELGCTNSQYLPGCRPFIQDSIKQDKDPGNLRLIYLAHITREKGPLVLLEALRILEQEGVNRVSCDFFGPIHDEIRNEFLQQVEVTSFSRYRGEAEAGSGTRLISQYDALVLPTNFDAEGHPGVIIEAMHAEVPVISTQFRTIPELITHGENGLLVPVKDCRALAGAIRELALDCSLRERLGRENFRRGQAFRSDVVVARMLEIVFPAGG